MVANLVCTTDSSSAKPRSMTSPAACPTGDCAAAVIATVGTVPASRPSSCTISVVVPDRDSTRTRS